MLSIISLDFISNKSYVNLSRDLIINYMKIFVFFEITVSKNFEGYLFINV